MEASAERLRSAPTPAQLEEMSKASVHRKLVSQARKAAARDASLRLDHATWHNSQQRRALFDPHNFARAHSSKARLMEDRHRVLYQPSVPRFAASPPPAAPRSSLNEAQLPEWTLGVMRALSVEQPHFRDALQELTSRAPSAYRPSVSLAAAEVQFDPAAEPGRFYSSLKAKLAALREDVAQPRAAAKRLHTPPECQPPLTLQAAQVGVQPSKAAEADEAEQLGQLEHEAEAVYLTSIEYLSSLGISVDNPAAEAAAWNEAKAAAERAAAEAEACLRSVVSSESDQLS